MKHTRGGSLSAKEEQEETTTDPLDFHFLHVSLQKESRYLDIQLGDFLSRGMLAEFESVLAWVASRVEVHGVLIRPMGPSAPSSLAPGQWESCPRGELGELLAQIRRLVIGMFYLPQTIVMDLGKGCADLGAELALGADIRVASQGAELSWNQLQRGRSPASGGCGILPLIVGEARARAWLLGTCNVGTQELLGCGFLALAYREQKEVVALMASLGLQAPVARIQTKRALLENIMGALDRAHVSENRIALAALLTEDYRCSGQSFSSAQGFAVRLKESGGLS